MSHQNDDTGRRELPSTRAPRRERWSWAVYDFAATIFSMNVITLYFAVWLVSDLGASNTALAIGNAGASLLVLVAIPALGAISDARRRRKPWVVGFTLLACVATAAIGVLGQRTVPLVGAETVGGTAARGAWHASLGSVGWVLLAFIIADFSYQAAQPFYNAMLAELVPPREQGRLSGIGTAIGYTGSIVGVILVLPFFNGQLPVIGALPASATALLRAIPFTAHAGRVSTFVPTALLYLLFALPLFMFCRDHDPAPRGTAIGVRDAFREVRLTLRDARAHPGLLRFILASFIYQDAIGTIIGFMTLYAVKALGFAQGSEVKLFLVLTIPAIFGSYIYGHLADRFGARRTLEWSVAIWVVLLVAMIAVPTQGAFWIVGLAIGLNFGGVHTAERPVLLSLVPEQEAGRYFSLLLLSARAAAVAGPIIWALTVDGLEGSLGTGVAYRAAVGTVAIMFTIAWFVLRRVPSRVPNDSLALSVG